MKLTIVNNKLAPDSVVAIVDALNIERNTNSFLNPSVNICFVAARSTQLYRINKYENAITSEKLGKLRVDSVAKR